MTEEIRNKQRSRIGFGSSYRKGSDKDLGKQNEIGAVLGGQVWMVSPDKKADMMNPCLWMQAEVVKAKNCNNFYDCNSCKYDMGMSKQVEKGKKVSWQDAMRRRPAMDRICRHSLTKRILNRVCADNYQCSTCDFDQCFEDFLSTRTITTLFEVQQVKGFDVPMEYYFHDGHTWARIESGGYIRIGIDDFAMKLIGKTDGLDLPLMGKELNQGEIGWGLKCKDNLADIRSPIGGVITEVNPKVRENPELANQDPYSGGWLFMLRNPNSIKEEVEPLMDNTKSLDWMNEEVKTLENMIEEVAGPMATDGGLFQEDIFGNLPDLGWNNLTKTFLKT